jgi:DNA-binding GntR family transcriptional regulator
MEDFGESKSPKKFTMMQSYERYSLHSQVFNYIRDAILNGRYKPGDPLVETKLAEELGVSRTPIREAIRQLELEGLVISIPNKGVVVDGVSQQDIDDIYTIRSMLEGLAARWAAQRIDEQGLKALEEIIELMEYYTKKNDFDQLTQLDTRFHGELYDSCGSKVLKHTLGNLLRYVQRARRGSLKVPSRAQLALNEHRGIFEAIMRRDAEEAERLMADHIFRASLNLHSHVEQDGHYDS